MKNWNSITSLAEDIGISERTAWRWLKRGKIERHRDEDGKIFFTLKADPDTSLTTDTDSKKLSHTDISVSVDEISKASSSSDRERRRRRFHLFLPEIDYEKAPPELVEEYVKTKKEKWKADQAESQVRQIKAHLKTEKLLSQKKKEPERRRQEERKRAWIEGWKRFAYKCFSIINSPPPIEARVKINEIVKTILDDEGMDGDIDRIRLSIENEMNRLREEFNEKYLYPKLKEELITSVIRNLYILDTGDVQKLVKERVKRLLEERIRGDEFPEEIFELGEQLKEIEEKKIEEKKMRQELYSRKGLVNG